MFFTDVSIAGPPCSPPGERTSLIAIAWPVLSSFSLDERQGIETGAFHRFAARPPLECHRCFHCCFRTPPCHSPHPASDQASSCLPRHRQAVRLRCFKHWRVIDAFQRCFHRWPALPSTEGERAPLMLIACPVFSSFSLDESQGIETKTDPLAQAVFDIVWGRGYTLDMNVREIQAKTLLWPRPPARANSRPVSALRTASPTLP
jgi:hypothetical protein